MKIGILTYHCVPNFGAQLQTLSTIGYLRKKGIEPIVLHWYPIDLEEYYHKRVSPEQCNLQMKFAEKEMPLSKRLTSLNEFCREVDNLNLNGIIIGSDAIFDYIPERDRYNLSLRRLKKIPIKTTSNHRLPNPFWGSFITKLKRPIPVCAFSASSQNMPYHLLNKKERQNLGLLLNSFTCITTRDKWTCNMVMNLSNRKNILITPDPVFSFNNNTQYNLTKEEICRKFNLPKDYLLISVLSPLIKDKFINEIIYKIESQTKIHCVSFPMPDKLRVFDTKYKIELPLSPIDWYYLIKYSKGYIGERMHPIIVSLHNLVPFYCFDQYGAKKSIIPRLWEKIIPQSSKIYDVLDDSGFLRNMSFISELENLTANDIIQHFLSFDINQCQEFAIKRQKDYEMGMESILAYFKE